MPPTIHLSFKAFKISLVRVYVTFYVASLVVNTNCSFVKILNLVK